MRSVGRGVAALLAPALLGGAGSAVALALVLGPTAPVPAAAATRPCVGMIVDGRLAGGSLRTGCATGDPRSGLAALTAAGFSYAFVPRQPGQVCQIDGLPECSRNGSDTYWSYWHRAKGIHRWVYSGEGAGDLRPGARRHRGLGLAGGRQAPAAGHRVRHALPAGGGCRRRALRPADAGGHREEVDHAHARPAPATCRCRDLTTTPPGAEAEPDQRQPPSSPAATTPRSPPPTTTTADATTEPSPSTVAGREHRRRRRPAVGRTGGRGRRWSRCSAARRSPGPGVPAARRDPAAARAAPGRLVAVGASGWRRRPAAPPTRCCSALILAVAGFVVAARRTDAPWATVVRLLPEAGPGRDRDPGGVRGAASARRCRAHVLFTCPRSPLPRLGGRRPARRRRHRSRACSPRSTTGCSWPRCSPASARPTRWPARAGCCGPCPARCTRSASPSSSR